MSRIKPLNIGEAPTTTTEQLAQTKEAYGRVPNLYTTIARSPVLLKAYSGFGGALAGGRLSPREREIISLVVSQFNSCQYCLSAHTMLGSSAGLSSEEMAEVRSGRSKSPIAILAGAIVRQRGLISQRDIDVARENGIDDEVLIEVIGNVALNILNNYVTNVAATEIDFPVVPTTVQ